MVVVVVGKRRRPEPVFGFHPGSVGLGLCTFVEDGRGDDVCGPGISLS